MKTTAELLKGSIDAMGYNVPLIELQDDVIVAKNKGFRGKFAFTPETVQALLDRIAGDTVKVEALIEALNGLISASATVFDHTQAHLKNSVKLDYLTYKANAERALKLAEGRE